MGNAGLRISWLWSRRSRVRVPSLTRQEFAVTPPFGGLGYGHASGRIQAEVPMFPSLHWAPHSENRAGWSDGDSEACARPAPHSIPRPSERNRGTSGKEWALARLTAHRGQRNITSESPQEGRNWALTRSGVSPRASDVQVRSDDERPFALRVREQFTDSRCTGDEAARHRTPDHAPTVVR